MASNTENLNLLMKNPSTDGADTFNVQTMLNENWQKIDNNAGTVAKTLANILKPTTPPIIGLPPSTTPNDMFNVLAHAGDLHVWRKTVVTTEPTPEVPAGYNLGTATKTAFLTPTDSSNSAWIYRLSVSKTVSVDSAGNVSMVSPESKDVIVSGNGTISVDNIIGSGNRFFSVTGDSYANRGTINIERNVVYYVASGTTFTYGILSSRTPSYFNAAQKVVGYPVTPAIPAGTTTTYPVSTNRNAYQEGNDAKPAGYTLGEVVTGSFSITPKNNGSQDTRWNYAADAIGNITVSDDGVVSLSKVDSSVTTNGGNSNAVSTFSVLKGKYATFVYSVNAGNNKADLQGMVVFFPSDAVFSQVSDHVVVDRYQPVTGYAAIPANTTIEYLGCLGDKARVQVVSYVGTGTYGSSNPNSLTFDFVPKAVFLFSADTYNKCFVAYGDTTGFVFDSDATVVLHVSWNGKNISWFNTDNDLRQHNVSWYKYRAIAIG